MSRASSHDVSVVTSRTYVNRCSATWPLSTRTGGAPRDLTKRLLNTSCEMCIYVYIFCWPVILPSQHVFLATRQLPMGKEESITWLIFIN